MVILCCVYYYGTKIGSGSLYCIYTLLFCECKAVKTYNSHSSEPGSPRRDMQGLIFLPYLRLSLRRMIMGLGERSSRLAEWVSPKREFERVHYKKTSYYLGKFIYEKYFVDNFILSTKGRRR